MESDVSRLQHANSDEKHRLTKALGLRMQALKKQTSQEETREKDAKLKVEHDLERVLTEVRSSHLDSKRKEEIKQNVEAMKSDLEKIPSSSTEYKGRLRKALKLRMGALKQQVHEPAEEDRSLERQKEVQHKLSADLDKVVADVMNGPLPAHMQHEIKDNVAEMKKDLERMKTASPEYSTRLKKAMKLRTEALHEQVAEVTHPLSKNLERASAVNHDLEKILVDVKKTDMPSAKRVEIEQNVQAMQHDLEKMLDASPDYKQRLQQALHLRFRALKEQVPHQGQVVDMEREKKTKVMSDLDKVAKDVEHSKLSKPEKSSALANINQMKVNLEKMETAKPEYKQRLSKALKLRMDALKNQVAEEHLEKETSHTNGKEQKVANKVLKDLEGVLSQVHKSHPAHMSAIEDNIAAMKRDVTKIQDAHLKASDKKKLAKALSLRDQALEQQLQDSMVESHQSKKKSSKKAKVEADLEKVLKEVHSSHKLSTQTKIAAEDNIHHMQKDLEKLDGADPEHKHRLQKALGLRMKALNQQVAGEESTPAKHDTSVLAKTEKDLEKVKVEVKAAKMPSTKRTAVLDNISAMKKDLEKLGNADESSKQRLNKALGLRMAALKEQLAEAEPTKETPQSKFHKVMADLEKVESEVSKRQSMSLSTKSEVRDNIHHMKKDLEKMQGADHERKQRLRKALGLRMNVLKEKLGGK